MRHEETRDNTTAIENQSIEADAHEDTREEVFGRPVRPFRQPEERHEEHNDGANGYDDDNRSPELRVARAWWKTLRARTDAKIAREHDEIVAKARQESEERNGSDDEPEDDGQPSEYEEWQDYMGGDEYYDHSENECW
jgi:hypothetical protein